MLPTICFSQIFVTFMVMEMLVVSSEREHKVHNIVLYPEKHSWCQVTPIQQIITSPGFDSVTIDNNVCVGACYSYSIPKTQPAEPGELIGPYCDSCQPSKIDCYHVNLLQDDNAIEGPKILQKRVQIISNCSCQSCDKVRTEDCQISDENTSELPRNLFTKQEGNYKSQQGIDELPDILETNSSKTDTQTQNYKTWALTHHEDVESLFRLFLEQNRENNAEIDENMENKQKSSSDSVLDPISLYHSFLLDKNEKNNAKIEQDLKMKPVGYGLDGAPSGHKGNHVAMGLGHDEKTMDGVEESIGDGQEQKMEVQHPSNHHHHLHNHHLGDVEYKGSSILHLVNGPHGSMVAAPVKAKLHIDSDELKPNSEGVVIEYENPQKGSGTVAELFEH